VIFRFAVGRIDVVTVLDVLFQVAGSILFPVIVAKFDNEPDVAVTVPVMMIVQVEPVHNVPTLSVYTFPEKLPVDALKPVSHAGNVSEMTTHVVLLDQRLE
jgi:hypothetical protein